jgi:hypothetical protein
LYSSLTYIITAFKKYPEKIIMHFTTIVAALAAVSMTMAAPVPVPDSEGGLLIRDPANRNGQAYGGGYVISKLFIF